MEAQKNDPSNDPYAELSHTCKLVEIAEANDVEVAPQQVEVRSSDSVAPVATVPLTAPQLQITTHTGPGR